MKKGTQKKIKALAEEKDSIRLYKVATGETPLLKYLKEYIEENNLGNTEIAGTTLEKVIKANTARYNTLKKWVSAETNSDYKAIYEKEIKLLEDYAETVFLDILTTPNK